MMTLEEQKLLSTYPVPSWLDLLTEIKQPDQPEWFSILNNERKAVEFIHLSLFCLYPLVDNNIERAFQVCSNSISETGWGKTWRGWNFGGWKVRQSWVEQYKQDHQGTNPSWFRALGHVKSGDAPVVFYRGFNSPEEFYQEWVNKFVPRISTTDHRYHKTGKQFWLTEDDKWFLELCLAGYKGEVTQAKPEKSCKDFKQIVKRAKTVFVQDLLKIDPDGKWGNISKQTSKEANLVELLQGHWLNVNQLKQLIDELNNS